MSQTALLYFVLHSISVSTAILFGMLAAWVFNARWHWLLRTSLVGAALFMVAYVTDYAIAIWCASGTAFFLIGLSLWRQFRTRRDCKSSGLPVPTFWPRISLLDSLLLTSIIAAILTVAVNAPHIPPSVWVRLIAFGVAFGFVGLTSAWLVFSSSRCQFRALAAPFVIALDVAVFAFGFKLGLAIRFDTWLQGVRSLSSEQTWQEFWRRMTSSWISIFEEWTLALICGIAGFCACLLAARRAGWIDLPRRLSDSRELPASVPQRWLAAALIVAISALPCYVAGRWTFRPRFPATDTGPGSRYQELVDLGKKLIAKEGGNINAWFQLSEVELRQKLSRDEAELRRFREIIAEGCEFPWRVPYPEHEDRIPLLTLGLTIFLRMQHGDAKGSLQERIDACIDAKLLAKAERATSGFGGGVIADFGLAPDKELWNMRSSMSAQQCRDAIQFLDQYESEREPWEKVMARERLLNENSHYASRTADIAQRISGYSLPKGVGRPEQRVALAPRFALTELAIRRFELEEGGLPTSLEELVPNYLSVTPADPYGDGPFRYQLTDSGYLLYSVGPNGVDEGGRLERATRNEWLADVTPAELFTPPRRPRTQPAPSSSNTSAGKGAKTETSNSQK